MKQVDHALYVLNFERMELGLSAAGDWTVYYHQPCRHLDLETQRCRVHATPEQPGICVHYNPYSCWYKKHLVVERDRDFIRIDRNRMEYVVSQLLFNELRAVVQVPDWATLTKVLADIPVTEPARTTAAAAVDPVLAAWRLQVVAGDGGKPAAAAQQPPRAYLYGELDDPCTSCSAQCCQTLVFPHPTPRTRHNVDYLRFCLGFPGIEIGVGDAGWSIIVKTRCRHLDGNRCGIFGRPERPILCKYYDASTCTYRVEFGQPRPEGLVRVRLEDFPVFAGGFRFDEHGTVLGVPSSRLLRAAIEASWTGERAG